MNGELAVLTYQHRSLRAFCQIALGLAIVYMFGVASSNASAQDQNAKVNLGDYFALKRVSDPQISPDGTRVAYVEIKPDVNSDQYLSAVQIVPTANPAEVTAIENDGQSFLPRWSPDGTRLGYLRLGADGIEFATKNVSREPQANQKKSDSAPKWPGSPVDFAWSPDGTKIAALVGLSRPLRQPTFLQAPDKAKWTEGPLIYDSPVFQGLTKMLPRSGDDFAVFVLNVAEGTWQRVTPSGSLGEILPYTKPSIIWTPDGRQVMLSLNLAKDGYLNVIQGQLYAIDVDTGSLKRLPGEEGGAYFNPSFASDGTMGFSCRRPSKSNFIHFEYCIGKIGETYRSVTASVEAMLYPAHLATDGKGFFGVYADRGVGKLAWFGLDGKIEHLGRTGGGDANSYLDGGALTVSRNGIVAFLFSDEKTPSALAIVRRGGSPKILVNPNKSYIETRNISTPREVTYRPTDNASDVGAFLFPPVVSGRAKPPGIIVLHGGQSSDYGPDFDLMPQVFAAHGYMVLLPNYRGSGSYGRAFANASTGSPADREFDVIGGADKLVAEGADPERLYVIGGSGGGMITGWTIGRTNRFRAAVMWYPTAEWLLFAMESAVGQTTLSSFRNAPWDDPSEYIARSPYAQLRNIKTPTMLVVGEDDRITPISASIAFYRGLKVKGVDTELVVFPGAGHGIDAVPSQAMGHIAMTLDWLARYSGANLQPPVIPPAR
jgi:dipeptidyl aminopeptidase/acylaminoacyl peptidase